MRPVIECGSLEVEGCWWDARLSVSQATLGLTPCDRNRCNSSSNELM